MYLLIFDFDNTIAKTSEKGRNNVDVNESYRLVVKDIFGERGLLVFEQIGGLRNRAPDELVVTMLGGNFREDLIESAKVFFDREGADLGNVIPEGKGNPLVWDTSHPDGVIGEMLVRHKLVKYLLPQIGISKDGQVWPKPCEGFSDFYRYLQEMNLNRGVRLETAIISSGHDIFIAKTFQTWGLPMPDYLITNDDIRGRKYPLEMPRRVKPGLLPLALVYKEWLSKQKSDGFGFFERTNRAKGKMMYFGDDPEKDGFMAQNAKIPFGLFQKEFQFMTTSPDNRLLTFGDWRIIADVLQKNIQILQEGKPLSEIMFQQTNKIETLGHGGRVETH